MDVKIKAKTINNVYNSEVINYYENQLNQELKNILENKIHKKKKIGIFISYSHLDEDIKDKLDTHLAPLKRLEKISSWNDRKIIPGENWDTTIHNELNTADIILLLISANFINSKYIWDFELSKSLERNDTGECIVIPIFCKACDFNGMPFAKLQGLPKNALPIASAANIDEALTQVAIGIKLVVENILASE